MPSFPVDLRLAGRRVLVVGGGQVAARRVEALLVCGARVTVVAPRLAPTLQSYADNAALEWKARAFRVGDAAGHSLVLAALDDPAVGRAVANDAHRHGAWVSVADRPEACDLYFGAVTRRSELTVAVFTDGLAPGLAATLRDDIARSLDASTQQRLRAFAELRRRLRELDPDAAHGTQRARFLAAFRQDSALDALRAVGGIERALQSYGDDDASAPTKHKRGKVYLVGAGPGDPELLTLKAAKLITTADDLVVDGLVPPSLYSRSAARVVYVGKRAGRARVSQRRIAQILVELATAGRLVVRLKGGDPTVFGRAAEEIAALQAAGVAWEIVPGVSSAVAAPAAAGICITERGLADRVVILTGHSRAGAAQPVPPLPPYEPTQTVVVLMGLGHLAALCARARAAGYPAALHAAAVSCASTPQQQQVVTTLGDLPQRVRTAALCSPATIILGAAAAPVAQRGYASARSAVALHEGKHQVEINRFAQTRHEAPPPRLHLNPQVSRDQNDRQV